MTKLAHPTLQAFLDAKYVSSGCLILESSLAMQLWNKGMACIQTLARLSASVKSHETARGDSLSRF